MFIAVLFTITKLWKQLRWHKLMNGLRKMWCLHTMEFYSAIKKNEILSFAGKWTELENFTLSEVSQVQKANDYMFSFICGIQAPIQAIL
jgi:hypothetical protein